MDRRRLKFVLLVLGFALSLTLMILAGMNRPGGMVYYVTVSEFLAQGRGEHRDQRVNGKVAPGTIERLPNGQDVRFTVTDGSASLPVAYHGVIPDTFVDDAAVVVEGRLEADGTFAAHQLLAKCPSKYEAAEDGEARTASD